jgi:serine/threonine-protein kinase RsbW
MASKERQLRIVGILSNVSVACEFVVEQAREAGLDDRALHHCYLAVDEACTNIIEHGYGQFCRECVIDVCCMHDDKTFTITIIDDSAAFDPLGNPEPNPKAPLNERGVGGWGIFFIKKLMDDVSYSYEGDRNRLVMIKKIAKLTTQTREISALKPIEIRPLNEKVWVIMPKGWLDSGQSSHLAAVLNAQLDSGHRWLIVNMGEVEFISSAGLKMLVSLWQRIRDQKGDLALAALKPRVREVIQLIGLDLVFTISETLDQAEAYFATKVK